MPTPFTPGTATLGGLLIGAAAVLLLLANGRIAGISGILGGALSGAGDERRWRIAFVLGLPLGALAVGALRGGLEIGVPGSLARMAVAGLLVGLGTRLGSGCTSGHGVCGIGRGSRRSVVATAVFMATGALTVFVVRHLLAGPAGPGAGG
jgi:uncharacterized membrane protein YedE/YeeE